MNGSSSVPAPAMNAGSALVFSGSGPSASIIKISSLRRNSGMSKMIMRINKQGKHHIQLTESPSSGLKSPAIRAQMALFSVSGLDALSFASEPQAASSSSV